MSGKRHKQIFWVVALSLFGVTILAVMLVRSHGQLVYQPAQIDVLAPLPKLPSEGLNLHDGREIRQYFYVDAKEIVATHVGVGIANLHDASRDAVVTVRLVDSLGTVLSESGVSVGALRQDDVTLLPAKVRLAPSQKYQLVVFTNGVPGSKDLTVWYEPEHSAEQGEAVVAKREVVIKRLEGNIRLQILQQPAYRSLAVRVVTSWLGLGVGLAIFLLVLVVVYWRGVLVSTSWREVGAAEQWTLRGSWRELVFVLVVGLMLAFTVTLPYFTQLDRIATMGDVQRALVYRGVAREALLVRGEVALWEPYLCGGEPLLANMESAQLDPFFLLVLALGENAGVRLSVAMTLVIGFVGAYALARRYGQLPRVVALMAAALFSFSGFQMLAFANGNFAWIPVGWIPWVLYCYLGSLKRWTLVVPTALTLAFIFFGGSIHMVVYALLAAGFLGLWLAILRRDVRPLVMLGAAVVLFVPLIAIKLLPVAEIQAVSGDFNRPPPFIQPWSWIYDMFVSREQLTIPPWRFEETGENFRWIEYGAYVGIVPVVLFLVGLIAARRRMLWAMAGTASLLLLMTFGGFPWPLLLGLPFLDSVLRNPQRARVVFLLFFGILAGYGLMVAGRKLFRQVFSRHVLWAVVTALVLIDLATFHSHMYYDLFNLERPNIEPVASFERVTSSYTDYEENGYYKVSYENYRAGQGTTDMCIPYLVGKGVHARGQDSSDPLKPYFGEAKMTQDGEVHRVDVVGDTVTVSLTAREAGWLILNQNFFPGWKSEPPREVANLGGLVAARVQPGDTHMVLRYAPRSYELGLGISVATVIFLLLWRELLRKKS